MKLVEVRLGQCAQMFKYISMILLTVFLVGCVNKPLFAQLPMARDTHWLTSEAQDYHKTLQVQFQGTASGLLRVGDVGVLMDPFVSNPGIGKIIFLRKLQPDPALIKAAFPDVSMVKAIVVGHGHYDHLMDVPEVMKLTPDETKLFASTTSVNQVASQVDKERLVSVNDHIDRPYDPNLWFSVADGDVKIYPIRSEHSPHIFNYRVASGEIMEAMTKVPSDALDWKNGVNLNFVVQIKNHQLEKPYNIFIQSSASDAPIGIPSAELLKDIGQIDLAIICAANFDSVKGYPEVMLGEVKPKHVMVVHWDNFMQPRSLDEPNPLPGMNFEGLLERINQSDKNIKVTIPMPDAIVRYAERQ